MNCDIRWAASRNNIFHARMLLMPRDGAIIFGDLIGKLDTRLKKMAKRSSEGKK
jgi:hypothetical protein